MCLPCGVKARWSVTTVISVPQYHVTCCGFAGAGAGIGKLRQLSPHFPSAFVDRHRHGPELRHYHNDSMEYRSISLSHCHEPPQS